MGMFQKIIVVLMGRRVILAFILVLIASYWTYDNILERMFRRNAGSP